MVIQKYLSNIFISIVQQDGEWIIHSKVIKNGVLKDKFTKNFEAKEHDSVSSKMEDYLNELQLEYNFSYIALFLDSMGQGAINGTSSIDFEKHSVDIKSVSHFSIDNKWSVYASFIDINWVKKLFLKVGLDFIYSPFVVQYSLLQERKSKNKPVLYILNHQDSVTISIYDSNSLLFGAYFKTTTDENLTSGEEDWENAEEEDSIDNLVELDSIETDDLEELGEFDDLDSDSTTFDEDSHESESLGNFEDKNLEEESNLELFGRDVLVYKYLTSSLKEFYNNPLYGSCFIDTVVIFDGYEVSSELIDMIENELFMEIEMDKIDITQVVCNMAKKEVLL